MTTELTHFIGGKHVKGRSGRFSDVFNPGDWRGPGQVPAGRPGRGAGRGRERAGGAARLGGAEPAAPGAGDDEIRPAAAPRHGQAGRGPVARARQDAAGCQGRRAAGPGGRRVLHRCAASAEGRVQPGRRSRHRHVLDAPADRRCRGDHALQLSGDDPDVEILPGHRRRQRLYPEAQRARSLGAADAGRADAGSRTARGRAERRQRRQGGGRRHPRRPGHRRCRLCRLDGRSPLTSTRGAARPASGCSASAAPRTT